MGSISPLTKTTKIFGKMVNAKATKIIKTMRAADEALPIFLFY